LGVFASKEEEAKLLFILFSLFLYRRALRGGEKSKKTKKLKRENEGRRDKIIFIVLLLG